MPWNGAGVFQRIYSWVTDQANDIYVRADRMDTDSDDIAAGISNCIARDGQAPPTADIPWGGRKITGLADGINDGEALNAGQVSGDASTGLVSVELLNQTAFSTALPSQTGVTMSRVVKTDGAGNAGWDVPRSPASRLYAFRNYS